MSPPLGVNNYSILVRGQIKETAQVHIQLNPSVIYTCRQWLHDAK